MANGQFSNLRDARWEPGYRAGMISVKGDDGVVTNYNPRDLEALVAAPHTSKEQWTLNKRLVERRQQEREKRFLGASTR